MDMKVSPKRQVRNFLAVIICGIVFGLGVVVFLVSYYGPSGSYKIENVLLSPKVIEELWYSSPNPKTGGTSRFVFKNIEISYYDKQEKKWLQKTVALDHYAKFYNLVVSDKSLSPPDSEVYAMFQQTGVVRMAINVTTESSAKWQASSEVFQEVEFAPEGDYYRVELHEDNPGAHWAYFQHPNITEKAMKILKGS